MTPPRAECGYSDKPACVAGTPRHVRKAAWVGEAYREESSRATRTNSTNSVR